MSISSTASGKQLQTVSEADEQRLREASLPYLRELILFATNTGPQMRRFA